MLVYGIFTKCITNLRNAKHKLAICLVLEYFACNGAICIHISEHTRSNTLMNFPKTNRNIMKQFSLKVSTNKIISARQYHHHHHHQYHHDHTHNKMKLHRITIGINNFELTADGNYQIKHIWAAGLENLKQTKKRNLGLWPITKKARTYYTIY